MKKWASRKLWMTLSANAMMWAAYEMALRHLYLMPEAKLPAFTALTQTALYGITAVSAAYVGVTGLVQMRQNVASQVIEAAGRAFAPKYYDDGTIS